MKFTLMEAAVILLILPSGLAVFGAPVARGWRDSGVRSSSREIIAPRPCPLRSSQQHRLWGSDAMDDDEWFVGDKAAGGSVPMLASWRNYNPIPPGWRVADKSRATARQKEVVESLETWEICELAGGWKIDGPGYGGQIQRSLDGEAFSCQIIECGATTNGTKAACTVSLLEGFSTEPWQ